MKGFLFTLALVYFAFPGEEANIVDCTKDEAISHESDIPFNLFEDGWYTAKVTYSKHKNISKKTTELKVQIKTTKSLKSIWVMEKCFSTANPNQNIIIAVVNLTSPTTSDSKKL